MIWRWFRWGTGLVVLALACGCSNGPDRSTLGAHNYDQSCATNADCVVVDSCACGCNSPCGGPYVVVSSSARDRFEADRSSVRQSCLEPRLDERRSASCLGPPLPYCVDGVCRASQDPLERLGPTDRGPDEWDRTCSGDLDCVVATRRNCTLCGCDPDYVAVSRGEKEAVEGWDSQCDQYTDDCDQCEEPLPGVAPPVSAECVQGRCEVADPEALDFVQCPARSDGQTCADAGCLHRDLVAQKLVDGTCEPAQYTVCVDADALGEVTDITPYYHRDGTLLQLTDEWPGWTPCESSSAAVCDCRR